MAGVFVFWGVPTAASDSPPISYHTPVLAAAVRAWASGSSRAVDATLGGGGHATILREVGAAILGIDRDPEAIAATQSRLGTAGIQYLESSFAAPAALAAIQAFQPDRILLDLGVSDDFVNAIRAVLGPRSGPPDFARLFQALRIAVNEEIELLSAALPALRDALLPGGRIGVITYHSGEDRVVKNAFRDWARACICPPKQPICTCRGRALGRVLTKKPILPESGEVAVNPRARSAQFRVFEKAAPGDV